MAKYPGVRTISGRLELRMVVRRADGEPFPGNEFAHATVIGVDIADDLDIANLKMEPGTTGAWFRPGDTDSVLIDQGVAKRFSLAAGSALSVLTTGGPRRFNIAGVVHKPGFVAMLDHTMYVPLKSLQAASRSEGKVTAIRITLRRAEEVDAFVAKWKPRLHELDPYLKLSTTREARKQIDKQLEGVHFLSYLGGAVSMVAAAFIVFSTLSMGVSERQRTLAMLRAVGMFKGQVARLVLAEGIMLAALGVAAGIPLGLFWTWLLTTWRSEIFAAGMVAGVGGMIFAGGGSVAMALLAGVLPALAASRVSPVEAMSAAGEQPRATMPIWSALAGAALVGIDTFLIYGPWVSREVTFYGHFVLGIPCLLVGFFLLAPGFVWIVEKTLGWPVAAVLRVRYSLLRQQLSRTIWRAAGTAAALMVGLAVLVVMHTHGNSLINGWEIPDRFPDIFIYAQVGSSLTKDQMHKLDGLEGIKPGELMPIGITVPQLPQGFLSVAAAAVLPDATMFLAVDPDKAMKMMDLKFLEGDAATAAARMKSGRYIVITDELRQLQNLHVGSKMRMKNGLLFAKEYEYEVAGVVWSPGIDVFVAMFDAGRQFRERSATTVFGSLENGERDFGVNTYSLFAANLVDGLDKRELEKRIKARLGAIDMGMGDVRQIKDGIRKGFRKLLELVSSVALAAIAVAALGVTNTVMASIRSRRWHLGVLRSLGLTRGELLRLIVAESLLLGLVASVLGVTAGLLMSLNANGLTWKIMGYRPHIQIAWDAVLDGVAIIVGVALAASVMPAIKAAREEPLALLQTGRAG
jgi:putative ABC transport system permease protein